MGLFNKIKKLIKCFISARGRRKHIICNTRQFSNKSINLCFIDWFYKGVKSVTIFGNTTNTNNSIRKTSSFKI